MASVDDLETQINSTIEALEIKDRAASGAEPEIKEFLEKYRNVLSRIESGHGEIESDTKRLLNLARGYLESYSDYDQKFLNEMAETEKMIKALA